MQAKKNTETPEAKKNRETTESIAKNLKALVDSVRALLDGPLKRKTLLVLLSNASGLPQTVINQVLTSLENLEKDWINS